MELNRFLEKMSSDTPPPGEEVLLPWQGHYLPRLWPWWQGFL